LGELPSTFAHAEPPVLDAPTVVLAPAALDAVEVSLPQAEMVRASAAPAARRTWGVLIADETLRLRVDPYPSVTS
jgi:hypothetical protein